MKKERAYLLFAELTFLVCILLQQVELTPTVSPKSPLVVVGSHAVPTCNMSVLQLRLVVCEGTQAAHF